MAFYITCPNCGSNLDPGERCDCEREKEQKNNMMFAHIKADSRGQYMFDFSEKESGYREKVAM